MYRIPQKSWIKIKIILELCKIYPDVITITDNLISIYIVEE